MTKWQIIDYFSKTNYYGLIFTIINSTGHRAVCQILLSVRLGVSQCLLIFLLSLTNTLWTFCSIKYSKSYKYKYIISKSKQQSDDETSRLSILVWVSVCSGASAGLLQLSDNSFNKNVLLSDCFFVFGVSTLCYVCPTIKQGFLCCKVFYV